MPTPSKGSRSTRLLVWRVTPSTSLTPQQLSQLESTRNNSKFWKLIKNLKTIWAQIEPITKRTRVQSSKIADKSKVSPVSALAPTARKLRVRKARWADGLHQKRSDSLKVSYHFKVTQTISQEGIHTFTSHPILTFQNIWIGWRNFIR